MGTCALEYQDEVVLELFLCPHLETIYAVKNGGCYYNGKKAKVSKVKQFKNSYCIFGGLVTSFDSPIKITLDIIDNCYYSRGYGDCHGHSFVINGRAEIM
jgi:fructose-1,6-bisphosphatase/inositol monophosphatase family enzyme